MSDFGVLADRALGRQRTGYVTIALLTIGAASMSNTERSIFADVDAPGAFAAVPNSPAPPTGPNFMVVGTPGTIFTRGGLVTPRLPGTTRGTRTPGAVTPADTPEDVAVVPFADAGGPAGEGIGGNTGSVPGVDQLASVGPTPGFNSFAPISGGVLPGDSGGGGGTPTPGTGTGVVAPTPTPAATPTPTVTPSPTASPTPTVTPSPAASPTPTVTPSPTASPTPTVTPSPTASPTPTVTPSPTASPTPTVTPSPTASPTPTVTPTPTPTTLPPITPTPSPTATPTPPVLGAVPEPATWMMLVAGFGAVGAGVRRDRKQRRRRPAT